MSMPSTFDPLGFVTSRMGPWMAGFLPEIVLSLAIIALFMAGLAGGRGSGRGAARLAAGAVIAAGLLLLLRFPTAAQNLFGWTVEVGPRPGDRPLLVSDAFSGFFKLFVLAGTLVVLPMCADAPALRGRPTAEFYALLLGASLGMMIMASASNLLMIYLGIEFASLASYLAVAYVKQDRLGSEAGLKYVIYGSMASGVMIYGLSILYGLTGSLAVADIASVLSVQELGSGAVAAAGVLVFGGFAYKMAAFPMHFWCPDVYQGSSVPVAAYLSVASKAAGFAVFIRFLMGFGQDFEAVFTDASGDLAARSFGWRELVAGAAALSMTVGNLAALRQVHVRRMLGYSSVAHAGYLLMGVAVLTPGRPDPSGVGALLFYLVAYFFMNLGAFFVVNLVAARTGGEMVDDYRGLGRRSLVLGLVLTVCLVSLLGIPPTGGFTGKFHIFKAVIDRGLVWLAVVAGINTAISAYYYFKIIKAMYLDEASDPAPVTISAARAAWLVVLAVPVILLGIAFQPVTEWTRRFGL
jgi:NADH-quinone oxidoreductase subunit N